MRVEYSDIDLFWADAVVSCIKHGNPSLDYKELIGISLTLTDIRKNFLINKVADKDSSIMSCEFFDFMVFINEYSNDLIKGYELLKNIGSLENCVINYGGDGLNKFSIQFIISGNTLHLIANAPCVCLFSSVPKDVFNFTTLQKIVADSLELDYGWFTYNIGSLFINSEDEKKIQTGFTVEHYVDESYYLADELLPESARELIQGKTNYVCNDCNNADYPLILSGTYIEDLIFCRKHCEENSSKNKVANKYLSNALKEF